MPRPLLVPCVGVMTTGHGSWVMWVMGQLCDGSHGSWVTKDDPFPSLVLVYDFRKRCRVLTVSPKNEYVYALDAQYYRL